MVEQGLEPVPDLGAERTPAQSGKAVVDAAEVAQEPSVCGPMEPARTRDRAGVERKAVHAILPPGR